MLQLRIEAIKKETQDTATFYLKEVSGRRVHYKAGQFITLIFTHRDEEIRRSYSLSSSPAEDMLSITIKRIDNGEISRFMLTRLRVGDILDAVEPAGRFTITHYQTGKDIFLFAAGSGIVPIFAQLKYVLSHSGDSQFTLIYSSNNQDVLFKTELETLAAKHPDRLRIIYLVSSEGKRLNNQGVEQLVKQYVQYGLAKAEFYLCGPFAYMRMVRLTLLFMGVEPNRIRRENFVIETVAIPKSVANYPPGRVKIDFGGALHDITVGENQSILQAALQNNIQLPYSCRTGSCSTCSAVCKSGKVVMSINEVLTDDDLAEGWILTCTGHPIGDNVIIAYGAQDS